MSNTNTTLTGYCMGTKTKNVLFHDLNVVKNKRGCFAAEGNDGNGNKMYKILNEATANELINSGQATKGF